jgi:hypothetical protein
VAKKKKIDIPGGWIPLSKDLLKTNAFISLSSKAKIAYLYFLFDKKNGEQTEIILTFNQAKKFNICNSPTTFNNIKKELVEKGFLNSVSGGGMNESSIFEISYRWKKYGTKLFEKSEYKLGISYKYFGSEKWKNKKR